MSAAGPKFKMGKIVSKNLIIQVLTFVETYEEILNRLLFTTRSLRCLVVENLRLINDQASRARCIQIEFDYHQDNNMILVPNEAPINYGYLVKS